MLKYTKASINMLIDDCKKIAKIFKYVSIIFTILFLNYQIITALIDDKSLTAFLNSVLLIVFVLTTIVDYLLSGKDTKKAKRAVKWGYKWLKIFIKLCTLVLSIIEIVKSPKINGLQIILTSVLILIWVISLISQLVLQIVTKRAEILLTAFKEDVENIKRPFTAVSNTFKRITGKDIKQEKHNNRKDEIIDELNERIKKDKIVDEDD